MAEDKSSADRAGNASELHHFSEQASAQQVASSWSLISELEHLPHHGALAQESTPAPHATLHPETRPAPSMPHTNEPTPEPFPMAASWQAPLDTPTPVVHEPTPLPGATSVTESVPSAAHHTPPQADGASGAPAFGKLFSGYRQPASTPQTGEETPLKPLLHAIAQQGGA